MRGSRLVSGCEEDAEDLNKAIEEAFEDPSSSYPSSLTKKVKAGSVWSVQRLPKSLALPLPGNFKASKEWDCFSLHTHILAGIADLGFKIPTEIQKAVLSNLSVRAIVGSAPTGSGKTLAFSLPILQHLCTRTGGNEPGKSQLCAVILTPTRELALQVSEHIKSVGKYIPQLRLVCLVGGLSEEKQARLMATLLPTVIIATPGRLAEMAEFDLRLQDGLAKCSFLVVDEADRTVLDKKGSFPDLEKIFKYMDLASAGSTNGSKKRIFLFSATLTSDKLRNAFKVLRNRLGMKKLGGRDSLEVHIDSKLNGLTEYKVCLLSPNDKDKWLYGLLHNICSSNSGRHKTIIFVNSIEAVRRLYLILSSLLSPSTIVCPLHAQMQQRQRLKYLDRFKMPATGSAVLVCSDVAARGLDIPAVDLVIQAEPPKSLDIYMHRIGRTARAGSPGTAITLLSPKDAVLLKQNERLKRVTKLNEYACRSVVGYDSKQLDDVFDIVYQLEHAVYAGRKGEKELRLTRKAAEELGAAEEEDDEDFEAEFRSNKKISNLKLQLRRLLNH